MNTSVKELFDQSVAEGLDKNATMMRLVTQGGLSVIEAVREYTSLAREAGLIATATQRADYLNENLTKEIALDAEAKKVFVADYIDQFDLSSGTASTDISRWANQNGVKLPTVNRNSLADLTAYVSKALDEDQTRDQIVEGLQTDMGYTEKSATSAYSRALRELGISSHRGPSAPIADVVGLIRECVAAGSSNKSIVEALVDEFGYAKSTAQSFITYLKFAQEYAKQEMA